MATYINPLDRLSEFRAKLPTMLPQGEVAATEAQWRSQMLGDQVRTNPKAADQLTVSPTSLQIRSGTQNIRDAASRQHSLKLNAIQNQIARQRAASLSSYAGGGGPAPKAGAKGFGGAHGLLPGASNALAALNAAYQRQFGKSLQINYGYRSSEEQARLYALYKAGKGNLAAPPGHSVHEKGRAIDFGGPIQSANTPEHAWLRANAGAYGFKWTGKNFSQLEPWHWEWHG